MFLYICGLVVLYYIVRWYRERERVPDRGNKYVFITGCDSGFGKLLTSHLDKCGFCVVAACLTEKGEEELKKSCSSRLSTVHLNVTKSESIDKAFAFIKNLVGEKGKELHCTLCLVLNKSTVSFMKYKNKTILCSAGLWALVNNAGVAVPSGPDDWLTLQDYENMLDVNLNGVIGVTLSILPLIKKARGRVVNVASVFGRISPFGGPYSVSKYGVEAFNDTLR